MNNQRIKDLSKWQPVIYWALVAFTVTSALVFIWAVGKGIV